VLNSGRPAAFYEQMRSIAASLPAEDQSLDALWLRNVNPPYQDWAAANRARTGFEQRWRLLFQEFDAVLCPPMPTVAFAHDHAPTPQRRLDVDGTRVPYINNIIWAGMVTAAGLPATVAPVDRTATGLPIGVQIIGPMLEDRTPIMLASLMEREYGGFVPPVF
jgi:amidase